MRFAETAKRSLGRIIAVAPLLLIVNLGTFLLLYGIGNPANAIAGEGATAETIATVNRQFGFNDPILVQYWHWLVRALQGDLGTAFQFGHRPVLDVLRESLGATLSLVLGAVIMAVIVSLLAGVVTGLWPDSAADRLITATAVVANALPPFFLGLALAVLLAVEVRLLPPTGYVPISSGIWAWASHLILPWTTLALGLLAQQIRTLRVSLMEEMERDYVRTARMVGVSEFTILRHHIARNATLPFITVVGLQTPRLITAAVFVEAVFALPGLGSVLVQSVQAQDMPVVQGLVLLVSLTIIIANILVDACYELISPTSRASEARTV